MSPFIQLAESAEANAFAQMLAELVAQNLESKPHKKKDFVAIDGTVALVADDADLALTMEFRLGRLVFHDGIRGVPDVTVRGTSEAIMGLSNFPLTRLWSLPIPTDRMGWDALTAMVRATRVGDLKIYGTLAHPMLMHRLTRVMSVHG